MYTSPFFNLEQERRYQYLKLVGTEIASIAKHYELYADLGSKMQQEFASLRRSFQQMEVISSDMSINPLCAMFASVDRAFTHHFGVVGSKIVPELNHFMTRELDELASLAHEHERLYLAFTTAEEKHSAMKPSSKSTKKAQVEQELMQAHALSTLAFFEFCTKMDRIDLKLRSVLPGTFLTFLTSVSTPFEECLGELTSRSEILTDTQNSIQNLTGQLTEFSSHSAQIKQQVSSQIPNFWGRLKDPFTKTTQTSIHGYLWKRKPAGISKGWRRRFFNLSNGVLSWAKTPDAALRGKRTLELVRCSVRQETGLLRDNTFSISTVKQTVLFLQAMTQWDMNNWLAIIQNSIFATLNAGENNQAARASSSVCFATSCADCGAANASWASLNWGVTLCDLCCGHHRGLGAGLSRVRSLQLDTVEPLHRALVEAIGSERANRVLEGDVGTAKIEEDADPDTRSRFINAKYRTKAFVGEVSDIDIFEAIQGQDLMLCYQYIAAGKLTRLTGFTPLHAAAIVGNPLVLHLLCLNTPRADLLDEGGWSPLCYAAYYGQLENVNVLVSYSAQIQRAGVNPYDIACAKHEEAIMTALHSCADWSTFDPAGEYTPPRQDIQPQPFDIADWVTPQSNLTPEKPPDGPRITLEAKVRLTSAVDVLRGNLAASLPAKKRKASVQNLDASPSPK
jgi:hypothetical protein